MQFLNEKAVKTLCHDLTEAQVSSEFLHLLDSKVRDIIERSCKHFTNKKRITEMVSK